MELELVAELVSRPLITRRLLENRIRVVELVGDRAAFDAAVDEVRAAIKTLE